MFTEEARARLQRTLIDRAREDDRVIAAALVGSSATGTQDRWSDIDLALRLGAGIDRDTVIAAWTEQMYRHHLAVDHLDVSRGDTLYRVFLRADILQVDLSFWAHDRFRPTGSRFALIFGEALDDDFPRTDAGHPARGPSVAVRAPCPIVDRPRPALLAGRPHDRRHARQGDRHVLPAPQPPGRAGTRRRRLATRAHGRPHRDAGPVVRHHRHLHGAFAATCAAFTSELAHLDPVRAAELEPVLRELVASALTTR